MTKLKVLKKLLPKEWATIKVEFLQFCCQVRSTANGIILGFINSNEKIIEIRLYFQKSNFQRNKRRANIPSNEEVMAILLKPSLLVKLRSNLKFGLSKLVFWWSKFPRIGQGSPIQISTTLSLFQRVDLIILV